LGVFVDDDKFSSTTSRNCTSIELVYKNPFMDEGSRDIPIIVQNHQPEVDIQPFVD
jgi:hypothetical protein